MLTGDEGIFAHRGPSPPDALHTATYRALALIPYDASAEGASTGSRPEIPGAATPVQGPGVTAPGASTA
ncbi:hypothetical protein NKH18_35985 [Streptomyces sp. M10(2022)]